ncbi:Protein Prac2-Like [Manis pentadactyla]|nr:Protein Prac2-Like [Manis pentadactyla]
MKEARGENSKGGAPQFICLWTPQGEGCWAARFWEKMRDVQQARDPRQKNSKRKDPIFPGSEVLRINTCMYSAMLNRITAINNPFVWDDIPRFAVKEAESTEATHHLPSQDSMADVNGFKACPPVPPLPQREGSGAL